VGTATCRHGARSFGILTRDGVYGAAICVLLVRCRGAFGWGSRSVILRLTTVFLEGELDVFAADRLRATLEGVTAPAVIDLGGVRLLTAAALTELVRLSKRVGPRRIALSSAAPHIRRVLEIARFDQLFAIVERPEDFEPDLG